MIRDNNLGSRTLSFCFYGVEAIPSTVDVLYSSSLYSNGLMHVIGINANLARYRIRITLDQIPWCYGEVFAPNR